MTHCQTCQEDSKDQSNLYDFKFLLSIEHTLKTSFANNSDVDYITQVTLGFKMN